MDVLDFSTCLSKQNTKTKTHQKYERVTVKLFSDTPIPLNVSIIAEAKL